MKTKTIIPIMIGMFLISLASAITIYSGESVTLELDKPFAYYSIVGNSTPILLDIVQEGNNVTITLDKYSQNDTFDLIFFDKEKETITVYSGGGGGSSKTIYKDRNITKYVDREVEKIVEVEKEVPKEESNFKIEIIKIIGLGVAFILFLIIVRKILIFQKRNTIERRLENERKTKETEETE